jgi:hypothetical protein
MVLWETRSYSEALRRERGRVLARTELQDRWGRWAWRWRAPRRERALYGLGELAPTQALAPAPAPAKPSAAGVKPRRSIRRQPAPTARVADGELVAAAQEIARQLAERGLAPTRSTLAAGLRARGLAVSNARAGELLAGLRSGHTNEGES